MRFSYFELTEQNRETRTLLKSGSELRCSATVGNFCSSSGTRRVTLVTNPMIMRKGPERAYDKWDISVVIFYTDVP